MEETPFLIQVLLIGGYPSQLEPFASPFLLRHRKRSYLLGFNFKKRIHIQLQRQSIV